MKIFSYKNLVQFLQILLVFFLILVFGLSRSYYRTLSGDFIYYKSISDFFWIHHQLSGFKETLLYPPLANLFFLVLGFVGRSASLFAAALFSANLLFMTGLYIVCTKYTNSTIFSRMLLLLFLISGPLILYRFDLFVILLTALSFLSYKRKNYYLTGLFLGLAATAKVFPLIIFPYILLIEINNRRINEAFKIFLSLFLTILGVIGLYFFLTKLPFLSIIQGFGFNLTKAVHIESVLGTLLTLSTWLKFGKLMPTEFVNGIFSLSFYYTMGHHKIFSLLVFGALFATYMGIFFFRRRVLAKFDLKIVIVILLILTATSQVLSPQYLLWPIILFPFLGRTLKKKPWKVNFFHAIVILICTQIVYPGNYDTLIFNFFGKGENAEYFWVLSMRNIFLVILTIRIMKDLIFQLTGKRLKSTKTSE